MNRRISSFVLAATVAIGMYGKEAVSADDFRLEEVEVTAHKAQIQSESFRLVSTLTHEEIEMLPIQSVADILAYLPGLDIRSRGASHAQTDLSMHGGTFDQVLVMLNGISLQDAQTGHYALNIPVSPALIERIEVLQGTAANLTGAFSGAINIVTRDEKEDHYHIELQAGMNSYVAPMFAASWARGDVHVNTSVGYARSDGYNAPMANDKEQLAMHNSDYQLANLYLQTRWKGLDVQVGAQYKDAGLGMAYGFGSQDQFDATRTMLASIHYNGRIKDAWSISTQAAYRGQYDRYEWHRGNPLNRHWTHNAQVGLQVHYASSIGRTTIGAECRNEYIRSSSMGEHNRVHATLSAEQLFVWHDLSASLGVAGHYNTQFGWNASGAATLGYAFMRSGSVYVTASRSLRMPTYTDLYYDAGNQLGSDSLQAEKAWLISLGAQYTWQWEKAGRLHIAGSAYYRLGQDIIDWGSKCFTFGNMLEHLRVQQELSLNEVCSGLCTRSQLFKYENGTSVPKPLLADSLLQRLGITVQIFDFFCSAEETAYFRCRKQIILLDNTNPEKKAEYIREIEALSIAGETPVRQFLLYSRAMDLSSPAEREAALQDALSVTIPSFDWTRHRTRLNWTEFYMVYHLIRCHYKADPARGIREMQELLSTVEGYHFRLDQNRYYIPMMMYSLSSWFHSRRDFIALDALRPDYESPLMRYYLDFQVLYMYTHLCSLIRRDYRQYDLPAELKYTTGCLDLIGEHDLSLYLDKLADNPQIK